MITPVKVFLLYKCHDANYLIETEYKRNLKQIFLVVRILLSFFKAKP